MNRTIIHGRTPRRLYNIWCGMRTRCANKSNPHYGGKGIAVSAEWTSFVVFRDWALANGYAKDLSIDRIDSDKGYNATNCRWVTRAENARHREYVRLNQEKAEEIRRMRANGALLREITAKYSISNATIYEIVKGRLWRSSPDTDRSRNIGSWT